MIIAALNTLKKIITEEVYKNMSLSNLSSSNSSGAFLDYGEFRSGVYIQTTNQILYFTDNNGNRIGYQWKGLLPHTTSTNDPNTDGGISDTAWSSVVSTGFFEKLSNEGINLDWRAHLPTIEVSYNLPHKSLKVWVSGISSTVNDYWLYNDGTVWAGVGVLGNTPDVPFKQITPQNNIIEWTSVATEGQNQFTVPYDFTNISVFINGLLQNKNTGGYVVNGSTVTLNGFLKEGDVIHTVISNVPISNITYVLEEELINYIKYVDLALPDGNKFIGQCSDVQTMKNMVGTYGQKIYLQEYGLNQGSDTGGYLYWINNSTFVDDGVVFFRVNSSGGWIRNWQNGINAQWGGKIVETPDASDNLNKISIALTTFNSKIILPAGNIYIGDTWWINTSQLSLIGQGSSTWLIGKPTNKNGVSINTPIISVSNKLWDTVTTNGQYRLQDVDMRDFSVSGRNYPLNPTSQSFSISSRDGIFFGGVGWDFQLQRIWFYNLGRRAVVAEDMWDGDFLECKFHEIGVDKTFAPSDTMPQAMVFKRKVDSCNAIRITNCHFEHCYRGSLNVQDLCYSFFLLNNKFEAQNQNTEYPIEYPIYIGNNHRNFVWIGGMAVLTQQAKYKHYARIWGDATVVRDVKFTSASNNDGAALLDLNYGNYNVGATINISGDVRGDLNDGTSNVAPIISRNGKNDFSGTILKVYNPGLVFSLNSNSNTDILYNIRMYGIGTNTGNAIINQSNVINKINGLVWYGVSYTTLVSSTSKMDIGEYAMLYNLSTTVTFNPGDIVSSASLAASSSDGQNIGSSTAIVGNWKCMGYCPPSKVSIFRRV